MVQTASWNLHERSHRSVDARAKTESLRFKIVEPPANKNGIGRKNGSSFTNHAITFLKAFGTIPDFRHDTGKFVT